MPVARAPSPLRQEEGALIDEWLGHSRDGNTSKIHRSVDGHARLLLLIVTAGQRADISQLDAGLDAIYVPRLGLGRPKKRTTCFRVDRVFGARQTRRVLAGRGIRCVCPE